MRRRRGSPSDEFLETIACQYLIRDRGYAASLATEYFVTPRTVVSWGGEGPRPGACSVTHPFAVPSVDI